MDKQIQVRRADAADAAELGRLLVEFNAEFGEPAPGVKEMARRCRELLEAEAMLALLAEETAEAIGLAVLRLRPGLWVAASEAYLQELYVAPRLRGRGIGRALLDAAIELARGEGASVLDLNTGETDTAARGLYEAMGFSNREGGPDGPAMLYYEREI